MTVARISELRSPDDPVRQGEKRPLAARVRRQQALRPDPLTGWNGSGDTNTQVRLPFASKEAAIAYCDKHGFTYHMIPAPPVRLKFQAYADNFR